MNPPRQRPSFNILVCAALASASACADSPAPESRASFQVEEATISSIQTAIGSGETTCRAVVQAYIDRAKAYNGVCTALVTPDGADIAPAPGYVRAGAALEFPTKTVKASTVLPDVERYKGLPLDYGRMERSVSDPSVSAQMGMRVGIPDAGQVNALETLNLRGQRSVTCKGAFDAHPSTGPLPPGAPPECEAFRRQPDALERAAELDAQYGAKPDLTSLPMYCIVTAVKDVYDTKDMRTTANNDVNFAMDVPSADATVVARLRARGAIIYAKSVAHEFNGGPGDPGGAAQPRTNPVVPRLLTMGAWAGQPCNPYDTERVPRGSSGGSGVAVSANLATIGICEQSGASCAGPASRNGIATLLTTKGLLPDNGGIGYQWLNDRAGVHARTLADAARVLDALEAPTDGYYDPRDPLTAIPRSLVSGRPYASAIIGDDAVRPSAKPLAGVRVAILREHMVTRTPNDEAISHQMDAEIKAVLRDRLGADLVETVTPDYPDNPDVPNLRYSFADALSELLPWLMPEVFSRRNAKGDLVFAVPGYDVTSYDYMLKLSRHEAPLTSALNITNFESFGERPVPCTPCADFAFDIDRYLATRRDSRITNWAAWIANAKFRDDVSRAGAENWLHFAGHEADSKGDRIARSEVARTALLRVMYENHIDVFVHPENTVPPPKILGPMVGSLSLDGISPFFQIPRIVVPAGTTDVEVAPRFALSADARTYVSVIPNGTPRSRLPHPMPVALTFFAGQGEEAMLIKVGTAYESATHHRMAPPAFGPVGGGK